MTRTLTAIPVAYLRNILHGLVTPVSSALRNRSLLQVLVKRELASRTHGTVLGGFWPLIQPGLQVIGFWFLFDIVYGMRFNAGPSFLDYLLVGMLPWLCMAEILNRSANMFAEFSALFKRNPFPLELLPILVMLIPGIMFTAVYFLMCWGMFGLGAALSSLVVIPMLMLWLLPFCLLIPVLGLFMRDFAQAVPFMLTLLMYATPILYFPDMLPESVQIILKINPLADLVAVIHHLVQDMEASWVNLARPFALWLLVMGPAWLVFRRSMPHIREVL